MYIELSLAGWKNALICGTLAVTAVLGSAGERGIAAGEAAVVIHVQQQASGAPGAVLAAGTLAFHAALVAFFTVKVFSLSLSVFPYNTFRDANSFQKMIAPYTGQAIPRLLSAALVASGVAPLTGLCVLVCIVVLGAGAVTLSLGAQEKEKCIARLAVCGLWAPARLAALVTLLTPTTGAFSIIPIPALQQALRAQLKPARSAGEALHAVWSFTGPARAVAEHTLSAVLVSVVALRALFHTGRVCERRKNES